MAAPDALGLTRGDEPERTPRDRRRSRLILVLALVLLALPLAVVVGAAWYIGSSLRSPSQIENAFDLSESSRPPSVAGTTFLLAGTDRRSDVATTGDEAGAPSWLPGEQRSDAIMLAHVAEDGKRAYVVSIPRDSWVDIPGYGMNKINAAFSFGGPSLYVQTIEQLTATRIDHLAVIDWAGLTQLVDALGGVDMTFPTETVARGRTWPAGTHNLSGQEVLDYVAERYALPRGDFDRVERQQAVIRSLGDKLISRGVLTSPGQAFDVATALSRAVSVDETLNPTSLVRLALASRGLRPESVTFMTAPTVGVGMEGSQSVVYLDEAKQDSFWRAFRTDKLERWIERNGARTTPETVG